MATKKVAETQQSGRDWNAMDEDEFASAIVKQLTATPAQLTCEQMDKIEARWRNDMNDRRCALAMLTKAGGELSEIVKKDRLFAEAAAAVQQHIPQLIEFHKTMIQLFQRVDAWLLIALAERDDMRDLLTAAKAEFEAPDELETE